MNMNSDDVFDDDSLAVMLGEAIEESAVVPGEAVRAAHLIFGMRTIDAEFELMTLLFDSSVEEISGLRADTSQSRLLTFQVADVTLEVELSDDGALGQLLPPQRGHITLSIAEGTFATADTDELGRFLLPRPGPGPIRFTCQAAAVQTVTDWIVI